MTQRRRLLRGRGIEEESDLRGPPEPQMFKAKMRLADTGVSWTLHLLGCGFGVEGGWVLVGDDGGMVDRLWSTLLPYAGIPRHDDDGELLFMLSQAASCSCS